MSVLADENIPWPLVKGLREMGIDITWIAETMYRGATDHELINLAVD